MKPQNVRSIRFRVRTLVAAVVVIGIAFWWIESVRRARRYHAVSLEHAALARSYWKEAQQAARPSLADSLKAAKADLERERVRHHNFRRQLQDAESLSDYRRLIDEMLVESKRDLDETPARILQLEQRARYHEQLKTKYERAAEHPWQAISADPPPPVSIPKDPPATEDESNDRPEP